MSCHGCGGTSAQQVRAAGRGGATRALPWLRGQQRYVQQALVLPPAA